MTVQVALDFLCCRFEAMLNTPDSLEKTVRLDADTIRELAQLFSEYLGDDPDAVVRLFGSRADLEGKGGDLDLVVVSKRAVRHAYALKKKLRMAIRERLGDQRVDILVVAGDAQESLSPFAQLALMESVQIWP